MATLTVTLDGDVIGETDVNIVSQEDYDAAIADLAEVTGERDELLTTTNELQLEINRLLGIISQVYGLIEPEVNQPPVEFVPDFLVEPGEDITAILQQANALEGKSETNKAKVFLIAGDHIPFDWSDIQNVHLRFADGARVEGMKPLVDPDWFLADGIYEIPYEANPELITWQGDNEGDTFNNRLMHPLLAAIGDEPLLWQPDGLIALEPGQFWLSSEANQDGTLYVYPEEGQSIDDFMYSPYWRLMWGNENTAGNIIDGGIFHGCSNTGKTGAVNFPGTKWTVNGLHVDLVNTIGIELGQGGDLSQMRGQVTDSNFTNVASTRAGQQGWWGAALQSTFTDCGHTGSNWKGFDTWWEASMKLENTHWCVFTNFFAFDCFGPGIWLDGVFLEDGGGNTNNLFQDADVRNCIRVGIELELGTSNNTFINCKVDGIYHRQFHPDKPWNVRDAYTIKAFSNDNTITGGTVNDVENILRLDNDDGRGVSDRNVMSAIVATNFEDDYFVLGPILANQLL